MTEVNEETPSEDETTLNSLQKIITELQEDLLAKDQALVAIHKDKDRMLTDIKKYRRINSNLKQQLEDERTFYLKEKEYYCKEMSVNKKIRKEHQEEMKIAEEKLEQVKEIENLKNEIAKLKKVLHETLEANYNLSIKFLRMKNTKYSLKARLKREQTENAKIISDLSVKLENSKDEINYIISDKFRNPIPPSNRKYLQVVKQNTQLVHDTLNYQVQISKLFNDIERIKAEKIKMETNLRLQYAKKAKTSVDKITEVNLTSNDLTTITDQSKESNTTIATNKDFLFAESRFSLFTKDAIRTHSAPEFGRNDLADDEEYQNNKEHQNNKEYQNT